MIPLYCKAGYMICFEALPEEGNGEEYFESCGLKGLEGFEVFTAKVSAWKDGKERGTSYLGACCYKTSEEFYTTYKDDYFKDMVDEAIVEAKGVQNV